MLILWHFFVQRKMLLCSSKDYVFNFSLYNTTCGVLFSQNVTLALSLCNFLAFITRNLLAML